jgi:hypothetical protein
MNPTAMDSVMDRLDYASIDARMMLGDLRPRPTGSLCFGIRLIGELRSVYRMGNQNA